MNRGLRNGTAGAVATYGLIALILGTADFFSALASNLAAMPSTGIFLARNIDTSGRTPVQSALVAGERTLLLVIIGQSMGANNTTTLYAATNARAHCLNPNDGAIYPLADPVLGASGTLGGFSGRLADKLIESGVFDRVIIVNLSVNATAIAEWATGGAMNPII